MDIHSEIRRYDALISKFQAKKKRLIESALFCEKCRKYYPKEGVQVTTEVKKSVECVYQDCGYGDDDEYAEVERLVYYNICPLCGHLNYKNSTMLSQGPSKRRWE